MSALKKFARFALIGVGSLAWRGRRGGKPAVVYTTVMNRSNLSGPGRFLHNLEICWREQGVRLERFWLGRASAALILIQAPGRWFYRICRWRGVRTVGRMDGFYPPPLFDGREHPHRSRRDLTWDRLEHNRGMQDALKACDWIIYQSRFSKEQCDRYLFHRAEAWSVIPNGVDLDRFASVAADADRDGDPVVVALGTWRDLDLVGLTLQVFAALAEQGTGTAVRFRLIGTLSAEVEAWLDGERRDGRLPEGFEATGSVSWEDLPGTLADAALAIQLKSGDWCPNAVLELMAAGVPVVCQAWGGTRELVGEPTDAEGEERNPGGLVIASEPYVYDDTLAQGAVDAVTEILADAEGWSRRARKRAERFDVREMSRRYREIIEG